MLARTAADNKAFTWLNMKTYAVCCRLIPRTQAIAPNSGPRWADTGGISSIACREVDVVERRNEMKDVRDLIWVSVHPKGTYVRNERSHMESKARPWATEARRPTVHI